MGKKRKLSDEPMVKAARQHGTATVMRALGYVACWTVAAESLDRAPTFDEYVEWWALKLRTAQRDREAFQKVSGLEDPGPIWQNARAAGVELDKAAASRAGGLGLVPYMQWAS